MKSMNISKMVRKNWILILIIFVATMLRFYRLGDYPIHLTNDEAGIGYNAYSILKTARDEHGSFMPVVFKSFGDWKPGFYIYLTVPFVLLFGLTEFAIRFPSALFGVLTVGYIYLITNKMFGKNVALFASFSLAISSWHIQFSRGAWEANAALALLVIAIWFFIKCFEKQKFLLLSSLFFGLTLWTYQSAKLASLLVLIALFITYKDKLFSLPRRTISMAIAIGVLISIPIVFSVFTGKAGRVEVMSVFSYTRPEEYIEESILRQENIDKNSIQYIAYHSEPFNLLRGVSGRYFNYFSGKFLFFEGDWSSQRHSIPNVGYLIIAELPALLLGFIYLLKNTKDRNVKFVLLWLLFAPIPAALTRDSVHGVRALNLAVPLSITIGFGMNYIFRLLNRLKIQIFKLAMFAFVAAIYCYSFAVYLDSYYIQNAYVHAPQYFYGYRETVQALGNYSDYNKIVFDQSYDQPYIFFLFYNRYDPKKYQSTSNYIDGINGDVGFISSLDKIEFRQINWSSDKHLENSLVVGRAEAFPMEEVEKPEDYNIERIKYPGGDDAFLIVDPI